MSREIKFRAWDKKDKTMRRVYRIMYPEYHEGKRIRSNTHVQLSCAEVDHDMSSFKRPQTDVVLMQYTGLKDKNGKEIYEGDIVKGSVATAHGEVKWHTDFALWRFEATQFATGLTNVGELEVIGNIYENPELLK